MRMWMTAPAGMCRKHLLGEHNELHMLAGSLLRGKKLDGFIAKGLLEPVSMVDRHTALAHEMEQRGYRHASPLPDCTQALAAAPVAVREARVNPTASARALAERCPACAAGLSPHESAD